MEFTREELFELVWAHPTTKIAADIGLSDVAVSKVCKRFNIPKPPLGYWAKIASGQKIEKPQLPKAPENVPKVIFFREKTSWEKEQEKLRQERDLQPPAKPVSIAQDFRRAHPLVKAAKAELSRGQTDDYSRIRSSAKVLDTRVTKDSVRRALLIWQTLIQEGVKAGMEVSVGKSVARWGRTQELGTTFTVRGEHIEVWIEERSSRHERVPTDKEKKWGYWPKWAYTPSGELTFRIGTCGGSQQAWSDRKKSSLEDQLGEILREFEFTAESLRRSRELQEAEAVATAERLAREEEERKRRERDAEMTKDLLSRAERWSKAAQLRQFLAAIEAEMLQQCADSPPPADMVGWLAWAGNKAEEIRISALKIQPNSVPV